MAAYKVAMSARQVQGGVSRLFLTTVDKVLCLLVEENLSTNSTQQNIKGRKYTL